MPEVAEANTALAAFEVAGAPLAEAVVSRAKDTVLKALRGAPVSVETIIVDRAGTVLARASFE